ncbi:hypothetical protein N7448_011428 [Penicillium atrosanguineum]|nr:hypothetical protein N7448_011428 [Penicillium atrosanguineum]
MQEVIMQEAAMQEAAMQEAAMQEADDTGGRRCGRQTMREAQYAERSQRGTHAVINERWRIIIFRPDDTFRRCLVDGLARLPQQQESETKMFRLR